MPTRILIATNADPRSSRRVAEAVRVAAGVGAWEKVAVDLYFHGPAVLCLDEYADEYPDGNVFEQYLPSIRKHSGKIYAEAESEHLGGIETAIAFKPVKHGELSKMLKSVKYTLRF